MYQCTTNERVQKLMYKNCFVGHCVLFTDLTLSPPHSLKLFMRIEGSSKKIMRIE